MQREFPRNNELPVLGGREKLRACVRWVLSPAIIVGATMLFVISYVMIRGPLPFYYESIGTLLLSPAIYVRLLPAPYDYYLMAACVENPTACYLLCLIPVLLLISAVSCAIHSLRRDSVAAAMTSLALCLIVFGTYHYLQPLGISFILL